MYAVRRGYSYGGGSGCMRAVACQCYFICYFFNLHVIGTLLLFVQLYLCDIKIRRSYFIK